MEEDFCNPVHVEERGGAEYYSDSATQHIASIQPKPTLVQWT